MYSSLVESWGPYGPSEGNVTIAAWFYLNHLHVTNFHFDLLCVLNTDYILSLLLGTFHEM